MKAVRMSVNFPGMMGGVTLPPLGEVVSLADSDADLLVERKYATHVRVEKTETASVSAPEKRTANKAAKAGE